MYIAIGIQMDGMRDVLGMGVCENESAKFWLGIFNNLKNRGVDDIPIACVDGLVGFTTKTRCHADKVDLIGQKDTSGYSLVLDKSGVVQIQSTHPGQRKPA